MYNALILTHFGVTVKFLVFFIIFWAVVGFSWNSLNINLPKTRWWQVVEVVILVPVVVWQWIKIVVKTILEKVNAKKN